MTVSILKPQAQSGRGAVAVTIAAGQKLSDKFYANNAKFVGIRFRVAPTSATLAILAGRASDPGATFSAIVDDDTGAAVANLIPIPGSVTWISLAKWAKYLAPFSIFQIQVVSNEDADRIVDIEFKY